MSPARGDGALKAAGLVDHRRAADVGSLQLREGLFDTQSCRQHQTRRGHRSSRRDGSEQGQAGQQSRRGRVCPTLELAAVDRVVAAPHDQPGQAHSDHGGRQHGEAAGHLGHHEHDRQWRPRDAAETAHHADDHIGRRVVAHGGHQGLEGPPDPSPEKRPDDHAGAEDAARTARAD